MLKPTSLLQKATFITAAFLLIVTPVFARESRLSFDPLQNTKDTSTKLSSVNYITFLSGGSDPVSVALNLINLSLTFLGSISLVMVIYAGFLWFTSGESEEKLQKAKDILIGATVGLALTLGALGLGQLLFAVLTTSTTPAS